MLATFRRSVRSWAAAAILLLALIALVVTGFGTDGMGGLGSLAGGGGQGTVLARVDGRELTEQEVSDIINRQYAAARQQQPDLDMATFLGEGFDPLVDQLVLALAARRFGEKRGLTVSQRMIDREIVNIPAFRNFAGQFDDSAFRQALRAQNITEAQLRDDIARSLMERQLLGPIARGSRAPQGVARAYADLLLERRRGSVGVVPTELLRAGIEPTEAEIAAFYSESRARFTIPERRVLRYAAIGPEQAAEAARATDQEIAAFYRQNAAAFGPRETRDLQAIVLADQSAAQAFAQRVRGGASFADAAGQAGFAASDIAFAGQSREQFAREVPPPVAAAAFAAEPGALVGPVRSELGFHFLRIERINRVPARPLEAVRDEIARTISQRKAADALNALIERIEQRVSDGASVEEVARAEGLQLAATPPVTATGQAPGTSWTAPPGLAPLLRGAFELDADDLEPVIEQLEGEQRFALLAVERVIPAAPPPLAQIRDQVRAALIDRRALERARGVAQQIAQRIRGGASPAQAFAQAQPRLPAPEAVNAQRLQLNQAGGQAPPPLIALFSLPVGGVHLMPAPNGAGWFVVHHAERTPGDAGGDPQAVAEMARGLTGSAPAEMAEQFARAVQLAGDAERNEEAIAQLRRRLLGGLAE